MKNTLTSFLLLMISLGFGLQSCKKEKKTEPENGTKTEILKTNINKKELNPAKEINGGSSKKESQEIEVFDVNEMLFNGKSKRFFTLKDFEKNFGKADSIKSVNEEEPCVSIFGNEYGENLYGNYLYKNGSRFETSKDSVAIDEFRFYNGSFLKYKNHIFNATTTLEDLRKIFPNAVKEIGELDVYGEGRLHVIYLKEDANNISDGHINVFIKNGKLYFMHWWFPC
jgi:hypothetical protein